MRHIILIFLCFSFLALTGQSFDLKDFNEKAKIAQWLCSYDQIAWKTSDEVMKEEETEIKKLGSQWFCFQDSSNNWHAYYGKDNDGVFQSVFHYNINELGVISKSTDETDTAILNSFSRALVNSSNQLKKLRDTVSLRFNQYVKINERNEIEVWILPAFQPNSTAVYGGEFHYVFDSKGSILISKTEYSQGNFRGFKVGQAKEITINYEDVEKPTVGSIFFVLYYKPYFTSINLETKNSVSMAVKNDDTYSWIHVEKKSKKKRRRKSR